MNLKNFFLKYQNIFFHWILEKELNDCSLVLDVGCGHSSPLGQIKRNFESEGIDIHKKTLMGSRKKKIHNKYTLGDIKKLSEIYKKKSFDACISIDVIEHINKRDALKLIKDMETVARKKVIVLTPNGFFKQHDFDGNPHQIHKSGWRKGDLQKLGYSVYGLRGLKFLRNDHAGVKYKPWIFWGACLFLSEIIFFPFANFSFDLYAVKNLNK